MDTKLFQMACSQIEPFKLALSNKPTIENELDPKIFQIQKKTKIIIQKI